jgi:hypothetical protein
MQIFGREPALWLGLVSGAVQIATALGLNLSVDVQSAINAIAAGIVAVVLAVVLKNGAIGGALMQVAAAGMALAVGFGLHWDGSRQGTVMAGVALLVAFFTRTQVTAPVAVTAAEKTSVIKAVKA